jgi:hypothetical protein
VTFPIFLLPTHPTGVTSFPKFPNQDKIPIFCRSATVNPQTQTTTHIETNSQPQRYTINRAELAVITVTLDLHKDSMHIQILTDSAFNINTLRNYAIDPLS